MISVRLLDNDFLVLMPSGKRGEKIIDLRKTHPQIEPQRLRKL